MKNEWYTMRNIKRRIYSVGGCRLIGNQLQRWAPLHEIWVNCLSTLEGYMWRHQLLKDFLEYRSTSQWSRAWLFPFPNASVSQPHLTCIELSIHLGLLGHFSIIASIKGSPINRHISMFHVGEDRCPLGALKGIVRALFMSHGVRIRTLDRPGDMIFFI